MSSKRELRFGTKGSFSVKIGGSKAGCWYNFETSVGGDIFDLIRIEHSGDFNDVIAFARDFCGGRTIRTSRSTPANQQPVPVEEHSLDWLARWNEGQEPRGSIVEAYLASRGLQLPDELANTVLRFHPALYHKPQGRGVPGMMALLRNVIGNEPTGVIRSFFDQQGRKIDRRMMGSAGGSAVKLSDDTDVERGLHICEGVETGLAGMGARYRPIWATGSAGGINKFPVLSGVDVLTVLGETEDHGANAKAVKEVAVRWHEAGREVFLIEPLIGNDIADAWQKGIAR